jgi:hypothetical protein
MTLDAGKEVAHSVIDAFKGNPLCLAAIVLAGLSTGVLYLAMEREADRKSRTADIVIERCFPLQNREKL